jgi:hypothetical protein
MWVPSLWSAVCCQSNRCPCWVLRLFWFHFDSLIDDQGWLADKVGCWLHLVFSVARGREGVV